MRIAEGGPPFALPENGRDQEAERMAAVWGLVREYLAWRYPDEHQQRLQRSVVRIERRRS